MIQSLLYSFRWDTWSYIRMARLKSSKETSIHILINLRKVIKFTPLLAFFSGLIIKKTLIPNHFKSFRQWIYFHLYIFQFLSLLLIPRRPIVSRNLQKIATCETTESIPVLQTQTGLIMHSTHVMLPVRVDRWCKESIRWCGQLTIKGLPLDGASGSGATTPRSGKWLNCY